MKTIRRGCFTSNALSLVLSLIGVFLGALAVRGEITKLIDDFSNNASNLSSAIGTFLSTPVIPLWLFFIVTALAFVGVSTLVKRYGKLKVVEEEEIPEVFRDLLFITTYKKDGTVVVINENAPLCGICEGRIVDTDAFARNGDFYYLICEEDHYVGQDIKRDDFKKALEADEKRWAGAEAKRTAAVASIRKKIEEDGATEEEIKEWERTPAPSVSDYLEPNTELERMHLRLGHTIDQFYEQVVVDFKFTKLRKDIRAMKAKHSKRLSN